MNGNHGGESGYLTYQRAAAMRKALTKVRKLYAQRQLREALRARIGPSMEKLHEVLIGRHVLV